MGSPCDGVLSRRTALFCVEDHVLIDGYRMGRHTHARPGLVLGLEGAWVGELGRHEHACLAGDVVVLPDGATHRERAGMAGGRCLLVSLLDPWGLERATRRLFDVDVRRSTPGAGSLARRVAAELLEPEPIAAEVIDALVLELIGDLRTDDPVARDRRWLRDLRDALDAGFRDPLDVGQLAAASGRSREHVQRGFRRAFGISPGAYVRARRLDQAARMLAGDARSIAAVAAECGFTDQSHLTRLFRARFGVTPARYRGSRRPRR
jgi:AraC-like DNA-binding protein